MVSIRIGNGEILNTREFIERCVRKKNVGYIIHQLEDKDKDVISSYKKLISELESKLEEYKNKSLDDIRNEELDRYINLEKTIRESIEKCLEEKEEYEMMLNEISTWEIPSDSEYALFLQDAKRHSTEEISTTHFNIVSSISSMKKRLLEIEKEKEALFNDPIVAQDILDKKIAGTERYLEQQRKNAERFESAYNKQQAWEDVLRQSLDENFPEDIEQEKTER